MFGMCDERVQLELQSGLYKIENQKKLLLFNYPKGCDTSFKKPIIFYPSNIK